MDKWDIEDKIKNIKIFIESLYVKQYNYIADFNIFTDELPKEDHMPLIKKMENMIKDCQSELDTN